jgi:hypothetical protein
VTTANIVSTDSFNLGQSTLSPFDSSLGTLTGITLQIDGSKETAYFASPITYPDNARDLPLDYVYGTADLAYTGDLTVLVNGVVYSFTITGGPEHFEWSPANPVRPGLTATGSATFDIDPSLFASFVDVAEACPDNPYVTPPGVCAEFGPGDHFIDPIVSSDNLNLDLYGLAKFATFTLTYTYTPLGVPEPGTWGMMLLGFAAISMTMRRRSPQRSRQSSEVAAQAAM